MDSYETIRLNVRDYVATVTITRPPVNAQNNRFRDEIAEVIDDLGDRADVRAIILTGDGKVFPLVQISPSGLLTILVNIRGIIEEFVKVLIVLSSAPNPLSRRLTVGLLGLVV